MASYTNKNESSLYASQRLHIFNYGHSMLR